MFSITDLITTKEAGVIYGKHPLTVMKVMKQHFKEGVDYRKIEGSEQLLINRACIEKYYNAPNEFRQKRTKGERKELQDGIYRI